MPSCFNRNHESGIKLGQKTSSVTFFNLKKFNKKANAILLQLNPSLIDFHTFPNLCFIISLSVIYLWQRNKIKCIYLCETVTHVLEINLRKISKKYEYLHLSNSIKVIKFQLNRLTKSRRR